MSDKKLKIILTIIIVPFLIWGLFTLLTVQNEEIEEVQEEKQEVVIEELDIEIIDLEGPKQKYINKTHGFSFEFPDEMEYIPSIYVKDIEFIKNYFKLEEKKCLKKDKPNVCRIFPNGLSILLEVDSYRNNKCNVNLLNKDITFNLNLYSSFDRNVRLQVFKTKKIDNIEIKTARVDEFVKRESGIEYGYHTKLKTLFCIDDKIIKFTLEDNYVENDVNINGIKNKYNLSYEYFQEIVNSLEFLNKK
ncbi:MAG: hypothetical protein L3J07_00170 [Candidatus Magasanikbacteria bacterium]|nr:hypothetical protein [Candidatus Magasanikbacteria bacterium]